MDEKFDILKIVFGPFYLSEEHTRTQREESGQSDPNMTYNVILKKKRVTAGEVDM